MSGDGLGNGKVAVHTDKREKEHAAVEADLVNSVHDFAHLQAQLPYCHGVGCPKGEG